MRKTRFVFTTAISLAQHLFFLNKMEDAIIHSMSMCDRVKVKTVLGADATNWERCCVVANVSVAQQGDGFRKCSTHPAGYGLSEKKLPDDAGALNWLESVISNSGRESHHHPS